METIFGLFGKQPISGKVKTRLAAQIGADRAARLADAFLRDLTERFANAGQRRFIAYHAFDAAGLGYFQEISRGSFDLWVQPEATLGARIDAFFRDILVVAGNAQCPGKVVLIGSDSPTLPAGFIDEAFAALDARDCVIGPAVDGGFYLIGLRRWHQGLFDISEWSTARVLEQIVHNLTQCDFSLHLLLPWYDVDTLTELESLRGHLAAMRASETPGIPLRTAHVLEQFTAGGRKEIR